MTVQGPVKEQQPDGMSHGGGGGIVGRIDRLEDFRLLPPIWFATAKGAYELSRKSFPLLLLLCTSALCLTVSDVHTHSAGAGGGLGGSQQIGPRLLLKESPPPHVRRGGGGLYNQSITQSKTGGDDRQFNPPQTAQHRSKSVCRSSSPSVCLDVSLLRLMPFGFGFVWSMFVLCSFWSFGLVCYVLFVLQDRCVGYVILLGFVALHRVAGVLWSLPVNSYGRVRGRVIRTALPSRTGRGPLGRAPRAGGEPPHGSVLKSGGYVLLRDVKARL